MAVHEPVKRTIIGVCKTSSHRSATMEHKPSSCKASFGGINALFCGDWWQIPPSHADTSSICGAQMRQCGTKMRQCGAKKRHCGAKMGQYRAKMEPRSANVAPRCA